jgi:hypothetical protein
MCSPSSENTSAEPAEHAEPVETRAEVAEEEWAAVRG